MTGHKWSWNKSPGYWCGQPIHQLCLAATKSAHLLLLLQPFGTQKMGNIPHRDGSQNVGPGLSIACACISSCICLGFCMCEMLATYALQLIIKFSLSFAMPYILLYVKSTGPTQNFSFVFVCCSR